ncbi:MAG: hypothetical protein J7K08_00660 [Thermoplasmata archaeon]|nr:hypothetical protein [Thermoplasmata archaeon]
MSVMDDVIMKEVERWYGKRGLEVALMLKDFLQLYHGHSFEGLTENKCTEFLWDYYPLRVLNASERSHTLAARVVYFILKFVEGSRDVV